MLALSLLSLLILVPVIAYVAARRRSSGHIFCIAGIALGVIIVPFTLGLVSMSEQVAVLKIPGAILALIHETPSFELAANFGLIPKGEGISSIADYLAVEVINTVIWTIYYGLFGYGIDYFRNKKSVRAQTAETGNKKR